MAQWVIDSAHSEVGFKVKHLVISNASGKFTEFEGTVDAEKEDFSDAKISFSAKIASIHTGQEQRDAHLTSPDFFDAANFPTLSFESASLTPAGGSDYKMKGDFTMKGITKPIEMDVDFGGIQKDLYGQTVAGFEITGKIKRSEFGLTWSAVTEAGGLVVGEDVKIHINAELIKKA
ncbi:MAG: YceI family protein [Chitinophagaceae bacterium]